jgi:ABC-2 type transport system permease protein
VHTVEAIISLRERDDVDERLLTLERESNVFWRLRTRLLVRAVDEKLRRARLRISLVASLSVVFWIGLFWVFYEGFQYLVGEVQIVPTLFNTFFASLFVMLVFSAALILYSGLYRSSEAAFLLTQPVRTERIFVYKFQEAVWFSSWGFLLMGSPMLVAYGVVAQADWFYYALLVPIVVVFVYIPGGLGAIICLLFVNWLPRVRVHAFTLTVLVLVGAAGWLAWSMLTDVEYNLMTPRWFQEMSDRLRFTEQRLLPSWWLSAGLLEASRTTVVVDETYRPRSQSLLFFLLLLANALFVHLVAAWLAGKLYRVSYSRVASEYTASRKTAVWWMDRAIIDFCIFLPRHTRVLLVKEMRLFRRDPVQWMQFLIFFGLLALYFVSIRRFTYNPQYSALIAFLNLAVVGLILSTFTTRFIFPMVSLEGKRFWILGLLPLSRDSILRAKFLFAAIGSFVPCSALILLSDVMLDVEFALVVVHQITCVALCSGLSAIAIGLGAIMPDLRESSPSKIAAGFGGTLNLVASALFIMVLVLLTAIPWHVRMADDQGVLQNLAGATVQYLGTENAFAAGVAMTIVLGMIATVWPLHAGERAFRRMEF